MRRFNKQRPLKTMRGGYAADPDLQVAIDKPWELREKLKE